MYNFNRNAIGPMIILLIGIEDHETVTVRTIIKIKSISTEPLHVSEVDNY